MSYKNILTGVIVALALVLAGVVVLIKTGVISRNTNGQTTTAEEDDTVIESTVVLMSDVNEDGDTFYYTMVNYYARPRVSSNHTYPTTKPKETESQEETESVEYVELTSVVQLSDENGNPLFDENGEPLTQVVSYTVRADETTTETTTAYVQRTSVIAKTDVFRREVTDRDGKPVTDVVYIDPPSSAAATTKEGETAAAPTTEEVTTTARGGLPQIPKADRQDALADSIVSQINSARAEAGLAPLEKDGDLTASARTGSMASALPEVYGDRGVRGDVHRFRTTYGGSGLGNQVISGSGGSTLSADKTKVGVAVVKYKDVYYTTVIYG